MVIMDHLVMEDMDLMVIQDYQDRQGSNLVNIRVKIQHRMQLMVKNLLPPVSYQEKHRHHFHLKPMVKHMLVLKHHTVSFEVTFLIQPSMVNPYHKIDQFLIMKIHKTSLII